METFYQFVLIASMVVGIVLIVYSILIYNKADKSGSTGYFETANTLKFLESSIDEIDKTMDELNETSKHIFEEMEGKYKELLLLYSLIDEKKKELADLYSIKPTDYKPGTTQSSIQPIQPILSSQPVQTSQPIQALQPVQSTQSAKPAKHQKAPTPASSPSEDLPDTTLSSPNIRKVRQLHQDGMSLEDTAKALGIGKGEVKLMLDLGKIK